MTTPSNEDFAERIERVTKEALRANSLRPILDPAELAHAARIPTSVVIDAATRGELPARYFEGLGWRVSRKAAEVWLCTGNDIEQESPHSFLGAVLSQSPDGKPEQPEGGARDAA